MKIIENESPFRCILQLEAKTRGKQLSEIIEKLTADYPQVLIQDEKCIYFAPYTEGNTIVFVLNDVQPDDGKMISRELYKINRNLEGVDTSLITDEDIISDAKSKDYVKVYNWIKTRNTIIISACIVLFFIVAFSIRCSNSKSTKKERVEKIVPVEIEITTMPKVENDEVSIPDVISPIVDEETDIVISDNNENSSDDEEFPSDIDERLYQEQVMLSEIERLWYIVQLQQENVMRKNNDLINEQERLRQVYEQLLASQRNLETEANALLNLQSSLKQLVSDMQNEYNRVKSLQDDLLSKSVVLAEQADVFKQSQVDFDERYNKMLDAAVLLDQKIRAYDESEGRYSAEKANFYVAEDDVRTRLDELTLQQDAVLSQQQDVIKVYEYIQNLQNDIAVKTSEVDKAYRAVEEMYSDTNNRIENAEKRLTEVERLADEQKARLTKENEMIEMNEANPLEYIGLSVINDVSYAIFKNTDTGKLFRTPSSVPVDQVYNGRTTTSTYIRIDGKVVEVVK